MHYLMQINEVKKKAAESVDLSQVSNMCTAIVRKDTLLVDTKKALVKYTGALKLQYSVQFLDARMEETVDDTVSANDLPKRSRGTV